MALRGVVYSFEISLASLADPDIFQVDPTLAVGDVKVSKDGGSLSNITTLPTVIDAGKVVTVALSATEMTVGRVAILFSDQAGDEWQDLLILILVTTEGTAAAAVWAYATRTLTQSAASVTAVVSGSDINILRGDTLSASITGLGNISDRSKLWLTLKRSPEDADSEAIVQVEETAGLIVLNGATTTASNSTLVVDDQAAGDITWTLKAAAAFELIQRTYDYDVQVLRTTGVVNTLTEGDAVVSLDTTKTIA